MLQESVEELPGGADEGPSLLVLLSARRLPDKDNGRIRIAFAQHGVLPLVAQPAIATEDDFTRQLLQSPLLDGALQRRTREY